MRSILLPALALAAVVVSACGSGGATGATPTAAPSTSPSAEPSAAGGAPAAADLVGLTFLATGADGHDLAEDVDLTIELSDGRISVHGGCNQMSGSFAITDGKLDVGAMMSTEMACSEPLMAQDTWISGFLPGATVALDGDTLTLARDGVTLTLVDLSVARPDLPLEGTTWVVEGLVQDQGVSSVPTGVTASLVFADGKVAVDSGCNRGSGAADIGDTSIAFGPIATTKMACARPAADVERVVLGVLSGDVAYTIAADALRLRGAGGGLDLRAKP